MPNWMRNTPWRQGALLKDETVTAINFLHPEHPDNTVVIVATHDCDLTQSPEKEPDIEVIIGRRIQRLDGNNTHAKSSRTLHLRFEGSESLLAEFVITNKRFIPKTSLVEFEPNINFKLSLSEISTFQIWLASRYRRSAFPDDFELHLKESGLAGKLAKIVKKHGEMITAVLFDVDEGRAINHLTPDDPYMLGIILLHEVEPDPILAERAANAAKNAIEQAFKMKLFNEQLRAWEKIELQYVDVVSEEALTYRQSKLLRKWRLDHISLGAVPQQSVLVE